MKSIGIDIGNYSVKVTEVEVSSIGYTINSFQAYPLHIDPNKDNELEILDILRNLSNFYQNEDVRFVLSVPQRSVSIRRRLFPFRERHKILKSLPFELEEDIPFSQADAIFDAKITRYLESQADIIATACPKHHVENIIKLSEDCNLNLSIISVDSFAFANLFENWDAVPPTLELESEEEVVAHPAAIILDFGYKKTNLLVYKDNYLLEVKTFDFGGHNLALGIASKYSLHLVESVRELELKSFLLLNNEGMTQDQIIFSDTIKNSMDDFCQELNFALLEIKSQYHINYTKASMTGGISQIKNIGPYMTQKTELPFARVNVLTTNPQSRVVANESDGYIAGVSIGLAIEGIKKPKNPPTNLLKDEFARQSQGLRNFMSKWSYTLSILAATFVFLLAYGMLRESFTMDLVDVANTNLRSKAKEVAGLKPTKANTRNIKAYIREQKSKIKNEELIQNLQKINSSMDVLAAISKVIPKSTKLNVKKLLINNSNVLIEGELADQRKIGQIGGALKRIARKGQVKNVTTQLKAQKSWSSFGFRFQIDRFDKE